MSERPQDRRDRLINQMVDVSGRLDRTNDLSEQNDLQALLRALGSALWLEVQPESTARDVPRAKGQANIERAAELDAVLDAPRDRLSSLTVLSWVALHAEREAIRKLLAENETE
jgi:propanediol dehydratase small subunit